MSLLMSTLPHTLSAGSNRQSGSVVKTLLGQIRSWWNNSSAPVVTSNHSTLPTTSQHVASSQTNPTQTVFDSAATDFEASGLSKKSSTSRSSSKGQKKKQRGKKHFRTGREWSVLTDGITHISRYDQDDPDSKPHAKFDSAKTTDPSTGMIPASITLGRHGLTWHNLHNMGHQDELTKKSNGRYVKAEIAGKMTTLDMSNANHRAAFSQQTSLHPYGRDKAEARAKAREISEDDIPDLIVLSDYYRTWETARIGHGLDTDVPCEGLSDKPEIWTFKNGTKVPVVRSSLLRESSMQCDDKDATDFASTLTQCALNYFNTRKDTNQSKEFNVHFENHGNKVHTWNKGIENQARKQHRSLIDQGGLPEGYTDLSSYAHGNADERSLLNNLESVKVQFMYHPSREIEAETSAQREAIKKWDEVKGLLEAAERQTNDPDANNHEESSFGLAPGLENNHLG